MVRCLTRSVKFMHSTKVGEKTTEFATYIFDNCDRLCEKGSYSFPKFSTLW